MTSLLLALLAAGPCDAPTATAEPKPEQAAVYVSVGEDELTQRRPLSAAWAFHQALELAPDDEAARRGLAQACDALTADAERRALAALDSKQPQRALDALAPLLQHPGTVSPAAALAAALALDALSRPGEAKPWLERAATAPALATTAHQLLALDAFEAGDTAAAREWLAKAGGEVAPGLRRALARDGRVVVSGSAAARGDSNVDFAPGTTAFPTGSGDVGADAAATVSVRPLGRNGPFLRLDAGGRTWARLSALDVALLSGAAGAQLTLGRFSGTAQWQLELQSLGWQPYALTQVAQAEAGVRLGPARPRVAYEVSAADFFVFEVSGYSGVAHQGRAGVALSLPRRVTVEADYAVDVDVTDAPEFRFLQQGPALWAQVHLGDSVRLEAGGDVRWRRFLAVDPDLDVARRELQATAQLRAEWDVGAHLTLFAAGEWRWVQSEVAALGYTRLAVTAGATASLGAL